MRFWAKPLICAALLIGSAAQGQMNSRGGSSLRGPVPPVPLTEAEIARLDILARRYLRAIQGQSIHRAVEYCAFIYRAPQGSFYADKPEPGTEDGCSMAIDPSRGEIVASFHTHSSYSFYADSEVPSILDLRGDIEDGTVGYIATPGGRFWRTNYPPGQAVQLCGIGCMPSDPDFRPEDYGKVRQSYTLPALRRRQEE